MTAVKVAYLRDRRANARAMGYCLLCTKRPAPRKADGTAMTRCDRCNDLERGRLGFDRRYHTQRSLVTYEPLDEMLSMPSTRVLRALRWFDWVLAADVLASLDLDPDCITYREHRAIFSRLVRDELVEHRPSTVDGVRLTAYRITTAGRHWLTKQLARANPGVWRIEDEEAA